MLYDTNIKEIIQAHPPRLLEILTGGADISEMLTIEDPFLEIPKPDFIGRLHDGRILHLQIQSDEADMPWRMLKYYLLIHRAHKQYPVQIVLYVGENKPDKIQSRIIEKRLKFEYNLIDIRELDGQPMIESDSLADNLLAILCKVDDVIEASHKIVEKIAKLPNKTAQDASAKLEILLKLRGIQTSS